MRAKASQGTYATTKADMIMANTKGRISRARGDHGHVAYAAAHEKVGSHWRREQSMQVQMIMDHAEMDGIQTIARHHGHKQRRKNKNDGRRFEKGSYEQEKHDHDGQKDLRIRGQSPHAGNEAFLNVEVEHENAESIGRDEDEKEHAQRVESLHRMALHFPSVREREESSTMNA